VQLLQFVIPSVMSGNGRLFTSLNVVICARNIMATRSARSAQTFAEMSVEKT